jgi:hypothetical protein
MNYHGMHTIFVSGIAIGKFALGSNVPLGTCSPSPEEEANMQESDTIIIDGPDKAATTEAPRGNRKRGGLAEDELNMTEAVKDVAQAIRDNNRTNIHPDLYQVIMSIVEYSHEALRGSKTPCRPQGPGHQLFWHGGQPQVPIA